MAYEINYQDERFQDVETDRKQALTENEQLYGGMAAESQQYYQAQINASKEWEATQQENQQAQTDFAIEQIEQQKEQAQKDYTREQSGAYVDWQKQSNQYGVNAEQMATHGLSNTGYSESSQVSMYNTYQNRVASARESYQKAVLNYDNAIQQARLQNNSVLAEIAYQSLQTQLELSLQGFQYKNQLLLEKANQKTQIQARFDNRYQMVLDQMNKENALQEELRQFNASYELQQAQLRQQKEIANAQLREEQRQFNKTFALQSLAKSGSSGGSGGKSTPKVAKNNKGNGAGIDNEQVQLSGGSSENKATMQSILALGYGPLSAKGLEELVAKGLVKETTDKNGNPVFKKAGPVSDFERLRLYQGLGNPTK